MQQNKALFFGIIGLAVLIVAGLIAARFFLADQIELPTLTEKVSIRVVVAPAIETWARQAAGAFNQKNPNTQVEIIRADGLIPEAQFRADPQNPPAAWLAEATFMVELARNRGLSFQDAQSVASSGLAWGAFKDKQEAFVQEYGPLSWTSIHNKATAEDNLKIVIASPRNSAEGLAALISATGGRSLNKLSLSATDVSQSDAWLTQVFDEKTNIRPRPAEEFATPALGRTIGDMGILTFASWRSFGLDKKSDFILTPAQPDVRFDYPLAVFSQASPAAQQAAIAFRAFLLDAGQQNSLNTVFLDPASASSAGVQADGDAVQQLLDLAGRVLP